MNTENIKLQKLNFKYDGAYELTFIDENKSSHKDSDIFTSACVDLYCLVQSCFEPSEDSILTCSCGYPECAGIYNFSSWITENEVFWHVNDDYFRFDKAKYIEEIRSKINLMSEVDPDTAYDDDDYFDSHLSRETFLELKNALDNYSDFASRAFPRYKVILCPDDSNKIYINESGKKIGFRNGYVRFIGKDFLGQDFFMEDAMEDLKKWARKINSNKAEDWNEWNSKGIQFARMIREELPPYFDVWYRFQRQEKEDIHILKDEE